MSDGIKAYYEELEEKIAQDELARLKTIKKSTILPKIKEAIKDLELIMSTDPSLTRSNWVRLDRAITTLKSLC